MDKCKTLSQHCQTPWPLTPAGAATRPGLYCKVIDRRPRSWAVFPALDLAVGARIAAETKPFPLALIAEYQTKKTVKKYMDYLRILGEELIRRVLTDEKSRKPPRPAR